jgi:hypothetical protein
MRFKPPRAAIYITAENNRIRAFCSNCLAFIGGSRSLGRIAIAAAAHECDTERKKRAQSRPASSEREKTPNETSKKKSRRAA